MNHPQPYNTQVLSTNSLSPNILLILKTLNNVFGSILPSSKKDNPTFINSSRFFANDLIREELAKSIISSTSNNAIKLVPFSRSSWALVLMLDSLHHIAYCIINKTALERQQNNRDREKPGYIQALLKLLNQGLTPSEPSLFPQTNEELFSKETCQAEFDKMFSNDENAEILKKSRLIIVEYTAPHGLLMQISALLLNQSFEIAKKLNLNKYIYHEPYYQENNDVSNISASYEKPADITLKGKLPFESSAGIKHDIQAPGLLSLKQKDEDVDQK